ncbi:MAG: hypothetical protein L0Z62_35575, partial [Gemmataceae bacterium]|nr:hypothetical protein [Gemmataceae bacterium]
GESVTTAPQFTENILSFAVAHGLALQGIKESKLVTNLLPHEIRVERIIRAKKPWAAIAAAALLLGVAGLALGRSQEKAAWTNPNIKTALEQGDKYVKELGGYVSQYKSAEDEAQKAKDTVRSIAAGVEERFNWNLLYQYINEALPRPNGQRLAKVTDNGRVRAEQVYFTQVYDDREEKDKWSGAKAFLRLGQRRTNGGADGPPKAEDLKAEDAMLKYLVQINIEGIVPLYTDDLAESFFKKLKEKEEKEPFLAKSGMRKAEIDQVKKGEVKLFDKDRKSGWIVEVRGFTYHKFTEKFVIDTLVENLAAPETVGFKPPLMTADMKTQVRDRIGYVFLYDRAYSKGPQFKLINTSPLQVALTAPSLLAAAKTADGELGKGLAGTPMTTGPMGMSGDPTSTDSLEAKGPDRSSWKPLGEIAGSSVIAGLGLGQGDVPGAPGLPNIPSRGGAAGMPGDLTAAGAGAPPSRIQRTEFVVFFVWQEPLTPEGPGEAPPTTP